MVLLAWFGFACSSAPREDDDAPSAGDGSPTVPTVPTLPTEPVSDADQDGFEVGAGDCDDTDPLVHPGAEEIPGDGIDQDCDPSSCVPGFAWEPAIWALPPAMGDGWLEESSLYFDEALCGGAFQGAVSAVTYD